jgi:hypothetical protein
LQHSPHLSIKPCPNSAVVICQMIKILCCCSLVAVGAWAASCPLVGTSAAFTPAASGLVHLTAAETDQYSITPPLGTNNAVLFQDSCPGCSSPWSGSGVAIGAVSNGSGGMVAVKYTGTVPTGGTCPSMGCGHIMVYNAAGKSIYSDGGLFTGAVGTPIMGSDGGVMAADYQHIARFDPTGTLLWCTTLPYYNVTWGSGQGGSYSNSGIWILGSVAVPATQNGPFTEINTGTGAVVGSLLWAGATPNGCGTSPSTCTDIYINTNSAATGTQPTTGYPVIWVALVDNNNNTNGQLVAMHADPSAGLSIASPATWGASGTFTGPTGASSLLTPDAHIIFDTGYLTNSATATGIIGFTDNGNGTFTQDYWVTGTSNGIYYQNGGFGANFPYDPVNGIFWQHAREDNHLIGRSTSTGAIASVCGAGGASQCIIDTTTLIAGTSGMVITADTVLGSDGGSPAHEIMVTGLSCGTGFSPCTGNPPYVAGIDLSAMSLKWQTTYGPSGNSATGSFPGLVTSDGRDIVAFSTKSYGITFVGPPPTGTRSTVHGKTLTHSGVQFH